MDDVRCDWLRLVISRAYAAEITSDRGAGDGVDTVQAMLQAWAYTVNLEAGLCDPLGSPGMAWPPDKVMPHHSQGCHTAQNCAAASGDCTWGNFCMERRESMLTGLYQYR